MGAPFSSQQPLRLPPVLLRHKFLTLCAVLALIMCRSEAFARHETGFWGRPVTIARGGSQQQQQAAGQPQQTLHSARSTPTCVMQVPPSQVSSSSSSAFSGEENNGKSKKNGVVSSTTSTRLRIQKQSPLNNNDNNNKDPTVDVEYVAETKLPTDIGQFQLRAYRIPGAPLGQEPCVIYHRDSPPFGASSSQLAQHVPIRIHDQCLTSEVFRSQRYVLTIVWRREILNEW